MEENTLGVLSVGGEERWKEWRKPLACLFLDTAAQRHDGRKNFHSPLPASLRLLRRVQKRIRGQRRGNAQCVSTIARLVIRKAIMGRQNDDECYPNDNYVPYDHLRDHGSRATGAA